MVEEWRAASGAEGWGDISAGCVDDCVVDIAGESQGVDGFQVDAGGIGGAVSFSEGAGTLLAAVSALEAGSGHFSNILRDGGPLLGDFLF